jgi:hypothetical protein
MNVSLQKNSSTMEFYSAVLGGLFLIRGASRWLQTRNIKKTPVAW